MKNRTLHLSLLIFFQLGAVGTYVPIITIYLKEYLGFSSMEAGIVLSIASIPSIVAPFISAFIADRIISSKKLLIICSVVTSILIFILSYEKSYVIVLVTYFFYMIFLVPSLSLVNSMIFNFIPDRNSFAFIRSWGTVGWILTGYLISFIWNKTNSIETMPLALKLSALFSIFVIILTLKLPETYSTDNLKEKFTLIPYDTLKILIKPEVYIILLIVFLSSTIDKFISYGTPIFLNLKGIEQNDMLVVLSYGQIPEIIFLFILTFIIRKLGISKIMVLAFVFQVTRFVIYYLNINIYWTIFGSLFQGFFYPLFYAPATIYLDNFATSTTRAGIHQIYNLAFAGLAGLFGNFLAGLVAENFTVNNIIDFKVFWLIPGAGTILVFFILLFYIKRYKI